MLAIKENPLLDPWWRLCNLYWIKNKKGEKVKFKPKPSQLRIYNNMHYRNVVLKNRQLGMTTFIQLFMLDRCLFNSFTNAGVVAHTVDDAIAFFDDKIKFAYDHLDVDLKAVVSEEADSARMLEFSNGSKIRVGTSLRSGTYQYIHISELGPLYDISPKKAKEVITGALNTIDEDGITFIESTSKGPQGPFYRICTTADKKTIAVNAGQEKFSKLDYKLHFFPWYEDPNCWLDTPVAINTVIAQRLKTLKAETGVELKAQQEYWYAAKSEEQGDEMTQENPGTVKEAFLAGTEVAIYGTQLRQASIDKRICELPIVSGVPVDTFWDIGRNDLNGIWLMQHVGEWFHFIRYFEGRLQALSYYWRKLVEMREELGIHYGNHYLPHDVENTSQDNENQEDKKASLEKAGMSSIVVVPRIDHLTTGIELTRKKFAECKFDKVGCEVGLRALQEYEWVYDKVHDTTRQTVKGNWAKNGADAFRQFAQGYKEQKPGLLKILEGRRNPFNPPRRRVV